MLEFEKQAMKPFNPFFSHALSGLRTFEVMELVSEDLTISKGSKNFENIFKVKNNTFSHPPSLKGNRIKGLCKHLYNGYKFM